MSSGDVGHFDAAGRLFIDGRDDDMIVSGGENLFPGEVEELLITHDAVEEAAVIGVDDEEFGKRLAAYVVLKPGRSLTEDEVRDYVKRQPRSLQGPARCRLPRRAAAHAHREGAEAQAPRAARRSGRLTQIATA